MTFKDTDVFLTPVAIKLALKGNRGKPINVEMGRLQPGGGCAESKTKVSLMITKDALLKIRADRCQAYLQDINTAIKDANWVGFKTLHWRLNDLAFRFKEDISNILTDHGFTVVIDSDPYILIIEW